jgi:hypothetical protein
MSTFGHSCVFRKIFFKIKSLKYFQKNKNSFFKKENPGESLKTDIFSLKFAYLATLWTLMSTLCPFLRFSLKFSLK